MRGFGNLVGNGLFFLLHPKLWVAKRFVSVPSSCAFARNRQNRFKVFMPLPKSSWNIWQVGLSVHLESVLFSARDCVGIIRPLGQNKITKSNNRRQERWEMNLFLLHNYHVFWGVGHFGKKTRAEAGEWDGWFSHQVWKKGGWKGGWKTLKFMTLF